VNGSCTEKRENIFKEQTTSYKPQTKNYETIFTLKKALYKIL